MKHLPVFAAALALLAACNKSEAPCATYSPDLIVLGADGLFNADVVTKVSEVTSLNDFYVTVTKGTVDSETTVWDNVHFTDTGSTPTTYTGGKYWPIQDLSYHFYAANVPMLAATAKGSKISATNDTDIVSTHIKFPAFKNKNTLVFEHIFARIGNVIVTPAEGYTITDLSISITPNTGGIYDIRQGYVQSGTTGWSNIVTGSPVIISGSTCPSTNNADLYLVPGTYTLTASWKAKRDEYERTYTNKTVTVTLQKNYINHINAVLGGDATAITMNVQFNEWNTNTVNATFPVS